MSWGAVAGAAIGVVGSAMTSDKGGGGGGGGQTSSTEPWMMAQPWMLQNIQQGQNLQTQYQNKPFSAEQQAAIRNQYGQSDYMRNLIPSLLGQMSGQQVGFDRNNPNARPQAWNWTAPQTASTPNLNQGSLLDAVVKEPEKQPEKKTGDFRQMDDANLLNLGALNATHAALGIGSRAELLGANDALLKGLTQGGEVGGYGEFRYGQQVQPGTQAYRDMKEYLSYGGRDPLGLYANNGEGTLNYLDRLQSRGVPFNIQAGGA